MNYLRALCLLGLSFLGIGLNAGQPAIVTLPPSTVTPPTPQQAPTEPKTTVKLSNQSGYSATVTYHYYKIPETSKSTSSLVIENKGTGSIDLLPNTQFSYALTSEGAKSPDTQVNTGDYSSGFYEIKPPATPFIVPIRIPTPPAPVLPVTPLTPAPAGQPTSASPTLSTTPVPSPKP